MTSIIISSFLKEMKISKNSDGTLKINALIDSGFGKGNQVIPIKSLDSKPQKFAPGKGIYLCYNGLFDEPLFEDILEESADKPESPNAEVVDNHEDLLQIKADSQVAAIEEVFVNNENQMMDVGDNQEEIVEETDFTQEERIDDVSANDEDIIMMLDDNIEDS